MAVAKKVNPWYPAPAILHQETACLKRHIFLTRDYTSAKRIRRAMFRPKLYGTSVVSFDTPSRDNIPVPLILEIFFSSHLPEIYAARM
jgi:hypothetical protein